MASRRAGAVLVAMVLAGIALGYPSRASAPRTAAPRAEVLPVEVLPIEATGSAGRARPPRGHSFRAERGPFSEGVLPPGTTVFDGAVAGVARLDPPLLRALRRAAADAADEGVQLLVNSGWRSPEHQARLLREAVSRYGSESEAARWVAPPESSAHVSGEAVDVGSSAAIAWLAERGAEYGLCQVYANELWHFELREEAADRGCPTPYADPTHDPRMRR